MAKKVAWAGAVKAEIERAEWNTSAETKSKWVTKMNTSTEAMVLISETKREIELGFRRTVDSVSYCAWMTIKVTDFDAIWAVVN